MGAEREEQPRARCPGNGTGSSAGWAGCGVQEALLGEEAQVSGMRSELGMGEEPGVGGEEQGDLPLGCVKVGCLKPLGTEASAGDRMYGLAARTQAG